MVSEGIKRGASGAASRFAQSQEEKSVNLVQAFGQLD
jgi:hypothetical protein